MDANSYIVEQMIRDRLIEAQAAARYAALLRQSKGRSGRTNGVGRRLVDVGRSLVNAARAWTFGTSRLLLSRKPITKRA